MQEYILQPEPETYDEGSFDDIAFDEGDYYEPLSFDEGHLTFDL